MGEMKPTPGPWVAKSRDVYHGRKRVVFNANAASKEPLNMKEEFLQAEANARLIAEAGTVFHNTGLSPVQLVEMVKELREALQDAEDYISGHMPTNGWGLLDRLEDADRRETLEKVRAALAKCEGVGNDRA